MENNCTPEIRLEQYSFYEIEVLIKEHPYLILPIGGYEPLGKISINGINLCCEKIAEKFAKDNKILMSPLITAGYTIPFKGFGGCAGLSRDTCVNLILDICSGWLFMGIKRILIITTGTYNIEVIKPAIKRLNAKEDGENVKFFSLQHNEEFRRFCELHFNIKGSERYEAGILALLIYLCFDVFNEIDLQIPLNITVPEIDKLKKWYRMGKDPYKLRKIAPAGFLSDVRGKTISRDSGKLLFDFIIEILNKEYRSFLTEGKYDS